MSRLGRAPRLSGIELGHDLWAGGRLDLLAGSNDDGQALGAEPANVQELAGEVVVVGAVERQHDHGAFMFS